MHATPAFDSPLSTSEDAASAAHRRHRHDAGCLHDGGSWFDFVDICDLGCCSQ